METGVVEESKVVETKATELPAQLARPMGPGGQAQGAKKRNRQKERMARREAERIADVEAAEQEASTMVDRRGIEREKMKSTFENHSLFEYEIRPDGHCLFSAVADQLAQNDIPLTPPRTTTSTDTPEPGYKAVRIAASEWIESHPDDFAPFLDEPLGSYLDKMRNTAEWGGQLELAALANAYGVEIRVVQDGKTEEVKPSIGNQKSPVTIWLAYYRHGYGLGEHYNSLRKTGT